jgi:WD40 repeat protein
VKFSPDGQLLALGSRDNYIYIYQVTDGAKHYTRLGRCTVSFGRSMVNIFTTSNMCI